MEIPVGSPKSEYGRNTYSTATSWEFASSYEHSAQSAVPVPPTNPRTRRSPPQCSCEPSGPSAAPQLSCLDLPFLGHIRLSHGGTQIVGAFIYTVMIGVPSMILLNWIGHPSTINSGDSPSSSMRLCSSAQPPLAPLLPPWSCNSWHQSRSEYWFEPTPSLPFAIVINLMIGLTSPPMRRCASDSSRYA